ncbi:hypothetical protein [Streptomyces sp. NPDC003996]
MVTGQWRVLPLCMGLVRLFNVTDYGLLSCMPSRLASGLHFDEALALVVLGVIVQPLAGALSDRVGRRSVAPLAARASCTFPALLLIGQVAGVSVAFFGGAVWLTVGSAGWAAGRVGFRCGGGGAGACSSGVSCRGGGVGRAGWWCARVTRCAGGGWRCC